MTGRLLRGFVVPQVAPLAMRFRRVRRALFRTLSQTAVSYPDSALSSGKMGRIAGGDRLPWVASLDNHAPLRALGWHVQVHGEYAFSVCVPVQRYPWSRDAEAAGFARNVPCLVRPDGHVAAVGSEEVLAALDRWLPRARVDKAGARTS